MQMGPQNKTSHSNHLMLKILFVCICVVLALYWQDYLIMPKWPFSSFSILWAMCVYRRLNNDKVGVLELITFSCLIRMGWYVTYNLYLFGKPYASLQNFQILLFETFIASIIYSSVPFIWIEVVWENPFCRWLIFIVDQSIMNGWRLVHFVNAQLVNNEQSILIPIALISIRSLLRPVALTLVQTLKQKADKKSLQRWLKIAVLNESRTLLILLVNYIFLTKLQSSEYQNSNINEINGKQEIIDILEYFNVCYYGFVGYLMFLQTYTL